MERERDDGSGSDAVLDDFTICRLEMKASHNQWLNGLLPLADWGRSLRVMALVSLSGGWAAGHTV